MQRNDTQTKEKGVVKTRKLLGVAMNMRNSLVAEVWQDSDGDISIWEYGVILNGGRNLTGMWNQLGEALLWLQEKGYDHYETKT